MRDKFKRSFWYIYLSGLFISTTLIFTLQGLGLYKSDVRAHILAGIDPNKKSYSLLHLSFKIINKGINLIKRGLIEIFSISAKDVERLYNSNDGVMFYFIMALFLSTLILITILMVKWYFMYKYHGKIDTFNIEILIVALFILSTIWIPFKIEGIFSGNVYKGNGSANIWHNPTALICKVFIFPTFYFIVNSFSKYKENKSYKRDLFLLSIFATLCMFSKPNFLSALIPAYMIYLFIELIYTKMKSFKYSIFTGIAFIPSVLLLYYQSTLLFDENNRTIIELGGGWKNSSVNIPVSIILALAFPIYVLIIYRKKVLSNMKFTLIWLTQIISGLQYFFLAEVGKRANHGNFSWGYSITMSLLFCISAEIFFLEEKFNDKQKKIGTLIFTIHVISGILYFARILLTGKWAI